MTNSAKAIMAMSLIAAFMSCAPAKAGDAVGAGLIG
jgi:hypothetical protein